MATNAAVASACITFSDGPVTVQGEEALIVWQADTQHEHFIRSAAFLARRPFAFLVPVPNEPSIRAVSRRVFVDLFELYRTHPEWPRAYRDGRRMTFGTGSFGVGDGSVEVVSRGDVAGLDTVILRAPDADGIAGWLGTHGFRIPSDATSWMQRYAEQGYYFVAARYVPHAGGVQSAAIAIDFRTARPFFPYSEPRPSDGRGRRFRVSVISNSRVDGFLVDAGNVEAARTPWTAPSYARPAPRIPQVLRHVLRGADPELRWLTTFEVRHSARDGRDLVFAPAAEQRIVPSEIHDRLLERPSIRRVVYSGHMRRLPSLGIVGSIGVQVPSPEGVDVPRPEVPGPQAPTP